MLPSSFSLKAKYLKDLSSLNLTETVLGLGTSLPSPGSDRALMSLFNSLRGAVEVPACWRRKGYPLGGHVSLWEAFGVRDIDPEMKSLRGQGWLEKESIEQLGRHSN